jgi:outer membrane protein assembly factor BamE (lipoprotein component of BamABCDE complex)
MTWYGSLSSGAGQAPVDPDAGQWQSTEQMDRNPSPGQSQPMRYPRGGGEQNQRTGADMASSHTSPAPRARRHPARAGLLALSLALAGCSIFEAPPVQRGNRVDPELIAQLNPGVQTKADVQALLGSPSATGTFDDSEWFYISSVTRIRPAQNQGVESQRVVAMQFDQGGVLRNIRELGPKDMRNVPVVERTTPVPGTDRTLLQALFGNIGRVGAGGMTAGDQGPGTGPGR